MRPLKVFSSVLALAIVVFFVVGAVLPNRWHVEKSALLQAPPASVYAVIADLRTWQEWAIEGDARCDLKGKTLICGSSTVVVADQKPGASVWLDEKIEDHDAKAVFTLAAAADGATTVTWVDEGALTPLFGGWIHGVVEKGVAAHMDSSLHRLEGLAQAHTAAAVGP